MEQEPTGLPEKNCNRTNYRKHILDNKGIDVWNNLAKHYKQIRSYQNNYEIMKSTFFIHIQINIIFAA